jgi:hypothetical protein
VAFGAVMAFFCQAGSRSESFVSDRVDMVLRSRKQENMELWRQQELAAWARSLFRFGAVFFGFVSLFGVVAMIAGLVN